mgnify:CR=1 FL=1
MAWPTSRGDRQRCAFCDTPAAPVASSSLRACADLVACSDRMQAQGLGRRDWTAAEQDALRHSLWLTLQRAARK